MAPNNIKIFGRIRPLRKNGKNTPNKYSHDSNSICFKKSSEQGTINNQREIFDFKFDQVFDQDVTQEEVFDKVAKPVIDSVLEVIII
jgi:kinesin family protein 6/9